MNFKPQVICRDHKQRRLVSLSTIYFIVHLLILLKIVRTNNLKDKFKVQNHNRLEIFFSFKKLFAIINLIDLNSSNLENGYSFEIYSFFIILRFNLYPKTHSNHYQIYQHTSKIQLVIKNASHIYMDYLKILF